jgi:hypothetical protein
MSDGTWTGELSALEERADIESLEHLHAERRKLLPEYASLRALHGPNGKWDAKRKAMLEAMKIRARMELTKDGGKTTEAAVDALGHADEQYVRFVDEGVEGATRYVVLETEMSELEELIRNREIALSVYGKEVTLR